MIIHPLVNTFGVIMGGHRRGQIEIMRSVLQCCMKEATKTKIVYGANLNFSRLGKYLEMLLSLGFLVEETKSSGSVCYKTTAAGAYFLEGCSKMKELSKENDKKRGRSVRLKPS